MNKQHSILKITLFLLIYICTQIFAAAPVITSFSPSSGPIGTLVTINGSNLNNPTTFNIGGLSAIAISNIGTQLIGMIMPNAVTGAISIITSGGSTSSASNFTITPTPYPSVQQGNRLVGTGNVGAANQAFSVSISADGNTAIVGGYKDNSLLGAVWIYTRSSGVWTQEGAKLTGSGATSGAYFGTSVALSADGNTAIIGGYGDSSGQGAAWVFTRSGGVWNQQGNKLVGTGVTLYANQGSSVSISADGNTAVVGGPADNSGVGAVWVFTRSAGVWTQQGGKLVGTGATGAPKQGETVSISSNGNTITFGGSYDNTFVGAVWIFTRSGSVWSQQGSKLIGTGAATGQPYQGRTVSLAADGNTLIEGGPGGGGAAWVFTRSGGVWTQQGNKLVGSGNSGQASQGTAVSISADGNVAIVGGAFDNGGIGATWVFRRTGGIWSQQGSKMVGTGLTGLPNQGWDLSLSSDGTTSIIGGNMNNSEAGAAWIFNTCVAPTIPTLSTSSNSNCGTHSTTLSIASGNLNNATNWEWYSGSCGGTSLGSGASITVSPTITTKYFARGIGGCSSLGNCDSITILVKNNSISTISATSCNSYTAPDGVNYTTSGSKTAIIPNYVGCDSTITINLTIKNSTNSITNKTACNNYIWNGNTYSNSGTHTFLSTNVAGCDSIATLNLTIKNNSNSSTNHTACNSYSWNGNTYTTSGTSTFLTSNVVGCDSIATLNLTINNSPAQPVITKNNLVLECNAIGVSYQWYLNNSIIDGATNSTYNLTSGVGGNFTVVLTDANACQATSTVYGVNVGVSENNLINSQIAIFPNPLTTQSVITFNKDQKNSTIKIIDVLGQEVKKISFTGKELSIERGEMKQGIYLLQIMDEQNNIVTKKIIVE